MWLDLKKTKNGKSLKELKDIFLNDLKRYLLASDTENTVIEISHCFDRNEIEEKKRKKHSKGYYHMCNVTLSIGHSEERENANLEDININDGVILQSHPTSFDNIVHTFGLDMDLAAWELVKYTTTPT
jgi:hypothetical protein